MKRDHFLYGRVGDDILGESYSLDVQGGLTKGSECTVWDEGHPGPWSAPYYSWHLSGDTQDGIRATIGPDGSTTNTLKIEFLAPGDYNLQLNGGANYSSSCGNSNNSDTLDIRVRVKGKKWEGEHDTVKATTGIQVGDGITSDVPERVSPQSLPMRFVQPGQVVNLSMASASDRDHWTMGQQEGDEPDDSNTSGKSPRLARRALCSTPRANRSAGSCQLHFLKRVRWR